MPLSSFKSLFGRIPHLSHRRGGLTATLEGAEIEDTLNMCLGTTNPPWQTRTYPNETVTTVSSNGFVGGHPRVFTFQICLFQKRVVEHSKPVRQYRALYLRLSFFTNVTNVQVQ